MKKFSINCDFGGQMAPFDFYIGQPEKEHHPLHFQADWLAKQRNGVVPPEVMNAIDKLKGIAEKNNVSLEDLVVYAVGSWDNDTKAEDSETEEDAASDTNVAQDDEDILEVSDENEQNLDDVTQDVSEDISLQNDPTISAVEQNIEHTPKKTQAAKKPSSKKSTKVKAKKTDQEQE